LGCFPLSILAIDTMIRRKSISAAEPDASFLMLITFWVVIVLFTIVKSKIVHYSSLCYFPIAWLAAEWLVALFDGKIIVAKWQRIAFWFIGIILCLPPALFVLLITYKQQLIPYIKDAFVVANLQADVHFTGIEWTISLFYLGTLVLFFYQITRNAKIAWLSFLSGTTIYLFLVLVGFMGRVEQITQNAVIEWEKELKGKPVYVITYNYKSYAHLFYQDLQPRFAALPQESYTWKDEFIHAKHELDTYIFVQSTEENSLLKNKGLIRLEEKNGFVKYLKPAGK